MKSRPSMVAALSLQSLDYLFFFTDAAPTDIYTLSLHDALPIWPRVNPKEFLSIEKHRPAKFWLDRKSTRLNSSHTVISYAVFCLKKKNRRVPPRRTAPRHHPGRCRQPSGCTLHPRPACRTHPAP